MKQAQAGQFGREHLELSRRGIELFNTRYYWECHEELEHHWLEARGDNARLIYWAIIQVAAAMVHFETENLTGVRGMLAKAREKIKRARESHVESEILHYNLDWINFSQLIENSPKAGKMKDYEAIHQYQFPAPHTWRYE